MSRTGHLPIEVPNGTKVAIEAGLFLAEGPKGRVLQKLVDGIDVEIDGGTVKVSRPDDTTPSKAKHGLVRALLVNAVVGASEGFKKELELVGVGYRGEVKGRTVEFRLGYSHDVIYDIPEGISIEIDRNNFITIAGADRQLVGQVTAEIRALRKPDAYKGKGFRYKDEQMRLKVGKAGVT